MTINITCVPDADNQDGRSLTIQRHYGDETTTLIIDVYGEVKTIVIPTPELMDMLARAGLRNTLLDPVKP